jgi:serine/threonine protein kinase
MRETDIVRIKQRYENIVVPEDQKGISKVSTDEIHDMKVFHESNFCIVYKAQCRHKVVAVKAIKKVLADEEIKKITLLSSIYHPNLLLVMGLSVDQPTMIITELMDFQLSTFLKRTEMEKKPLSFLKKTQIAKEAALGINWLHNSNPQLIHGAINPNNILIDSDLRVKISDFGLFELKDSLDENIENLRWIAPEVLKGNPRTTSCDIFSFGLILWMLITGNECPFSDCNTIDDLLSHHDQSLSLSYSNCSKSFQELIEDCIITDTSLRPIFKSITRRLEFIIIDTILEDNKANIFWKKNFLEEMTVTWGNFIKAYAKELKLDLPMNQDKPTPTKGLVKRREPEKPKEDKPITLSQAELELQKTILCFKSVLVTKNNVDLEWFGKIIQWFGTMDSIASLRKVEKVVCAPYFFGNLDAGDAEAFLRNKPCGTYLIRFSVQSSIPGAFTLSKTSNLTASNKNGIVHQRFFFNSALQKYYITENVFYDSIPELIEKEMENLSLTIACAGSPFNSLSGVEPQTVLGYVETK